MTKTDKVILTEMIQNHLNTEKYKTIIYESLIKYIDANLDFKHKKYENALNNILLILEEQYNKSISKNNMFSKKLAKYME